MPTIGRGAYDGGFTRTEARLEFLGAADRVLPRCRAELLELVPLVGKVDRFPSEVVALLENKDFALTVPRTPQDVQEVDVELVDGRVVRTTVVTRSAWRETWDGLLEGLDWWAKRWNAPPWMREVALATVVYAAAGWSRSWRLPPFEVHPYEPVSITVETPGFDPVRFPVSKKAVRKALQPWFDNIVRQLVEAARRQAEAARLQRAPEIRERDLPLSVRWELVALRVLKGYSLQQLARWTKQNHPEVPAVLCDFAKPTGNLRRHVTELQTLLG